jgi:DNA-binding MarR family transcriptional regulator
MTAVTNLAPRSPEPFYSGSEWTAEESIGYLIRQALASLSRAAEAEMKLCGLTSVQWAPLMIISRGGNPTAASLARDLNTDTGAMTRMLDRLEAKGLLTRRRSETDRRVVELALTELGRRTTLHIPHHLARVYNAHLSGFTAEEFELFKDFLRRVASNGTGTATATTQPATALNGGTAQR